MIYSRKYPQLHKRHLSHLEPEVKPHTTEPEPTQKEIEEEFQELFEDPASEPDPDPDADDVLATVKKSTRKKKI